MQKIVKKKSQVWKEATSETCLGMRGSMPWLCILILSDRSDSESEKDCISACTNQLLSVSR